MRIFLNIISSKKQLIPVWNPYRKRMINLRRYRIRWRIPMLLKKKWIKKLVRLKIWGRKVSTSMIKKLDKFKDCHPKLKPINLSTSWRISQKNWLCQKPLRNWYGELSWKRRSEGYVVRVMCMSMWCDEG